MDHHEYILREALSDLSGTRHDLLLCGGKIMLPDMGGVPVASGR